jgi:hypothetical protein
MSLVDMELTADSSGGRDRLRPECSRMLKDAVQQALGLWVERERRHEEILA